MAWFTGIFEAFGKSEAKAVSKTVAKDVIKSADESVLKTTSKITGSSAAKEVSGGRAVIKESATEFAKGAGSLAKIGGKTVAAVGIIGGTSLAAGKIYNYLADERAMTTAQREYENQIKLADKENQTIKERYATEIDYLKKMKALQQNPNNSNNLGASGGSDGSAGMWPIMSSMGGGGSSAATPAQSSGSSLGSKLAVGGIAAAAIIAGIVIFKKVNKKKGK